MRRVKIGEAINNTEPKCTSIERPLRYIRYIHTYIDTSTGCRDELSKYEFAAFGFKYTKTRALTRTLTLRYRYCMNSNNSGSDIIEGNFFFYFWNWQSEIYVAL